MAYVPSVYDINNPTDAIIAQSAQAEFRALKAFIGGSPGRNTGIIGITNTVAVQTVFSTTILGGSLGTNKRLKLRWKGAVGNITGAQQNTQVQMFFGGVTVLSMLGSFPTGVTNLWVLDLEIVNSGATNAQSIYCSGYNVASNGVLPVALNASSNYAGFSTSAVDTTVDCFLAVTVQNAIASPSYTTTTFDSIVEWL